MGPKVTNIDQGKPPDPGPKVAHIWAPFTRTKPVSFVEAAHEQWRARYGAAPLQSPLDVAGQSLSGRLVGVAENMVRLPGGDLPLHREPVDRGSWGLAVVAPDAEEALPAAFDAVAKGAAAGAALIAVRGGTALTRRLICEEARITRHATTLLVQDARDDEAALTEILSGRTDLVGIPAGELP